MGAQRLLALALLAAVPLLSSCGREPDDASAIAAVTAPAPPIAVDAATSVDPATTVVSETAQASTTSSTTPTTAPDAVRSDEQLLADARRHGLHDTDFDAAWSVLVPPADRLRPLTENPCLSGLPGLVEKLGSVVSVPAAEMLHGTIDAKLNSSSHAFSTAAAAQRYIDHVRTDEFNECVRLQLEAFEQTGYPDRRAISSERPTNATANPQPAYQHNRDIEAAGEVVGFHDIRYYLVDNVVLVVTTRPYGNGLAADAPAAIVAASSPAIASALSR